MGMQMMALTLAITGILAGSVLNTTASAVLAQPNTIQ